MSYKRSGSSRPNPAKRGTGLSDEDLRSDCEAAFLVILDDLSDDITSKSQLTNVLQQAGRNPSKKTLEKYWTKYTDSLSFDDFCEICRKEPVTSEDDLMKSFRKIDLNGDGFITNDELLKVMTSKGEQMSKSEVQKIIDEVDENKDGKLDYGEFCKMLLSTQDEVKKLAKDQLEKRRKGVKPREHTQNGYSTTDHRPSSETPKPRPRKSKEELAEEVRPSPRSRRSDEAVSRSPATSSRSKTLEPRDLRSWTKVHSKGAFFLEEDGSIVSHHYTLQLPEDSNVFLTIQPTGSITGDAPVDTMLFVLRENLDKDGNYLVTFTELKDTKGKYSVRCDLKAGRYILKPFTTGCRLKRRTHEPKAESKLVKKDKNENKYLLTKQFKDALGEIFNLNDLDGNGLLSREEFNWYNMRTSGEEVADEEWTVVEENVELRNGQITKKGFIDLNQMEADDSEGDTDDLWVTLASMGFNKALVMDQAIPFLLEVYCDECDVAKLSVKGIAKGGDHLNSAVCQSVISKGESKAIRGMKDLFMYTYISESRATVVLENKSRSKVTLRLDSGDSKNALFTHTQHSLDVPAKSTVVGCHAVPANEHHSWNFLCKESVLK